MVKAAGLYGLMPVWVAAMVPPLVGLQGLNVMAAMELYSDPQTPLMTTARYQVLTIRFVAVNVAVVLAMSVTEDAKSDTVEDCHLVMPPVYPVRLNVVLLVPVQAAVTASSVPPTVAGSTGIVVPPEFATLHSPLWTTARKLVVTARFEAV